MNPHLQEMMRDAARLTQAGRLQEATVLLRRAWGGAERGPAPAVPPAKDVDADVWDLGPDDVVAVDSRWEDAVPGVPPAPASHPGSGVFLAGSHTDASLTRAYKLFIPPQADQGSPLPLVVMLHGCKQDPDDFAAGTGMNRLAREQGVFVLYPAQGHVANPSGCWNWFKHNHQERGRGEPALIASMTRAVMRGHPVDPRRVYVAGLSAGGAMAAIVGAAYPDLFAAVGVHSGLAPGAARNLPPGWAALRAPPGGGGAFGAGGPRPPPPRAAGPVLPQPVIVFHGDMDKTVHPRNGEQVVDAALGSRAAAGAAQVETGVSAQGRRYTRSVHRGGQAGATVEHWLVHGAGHAWAGGQAAGSYTDGRGPDASSEMLRFFLAHRLGEAGRA